MRTLAIISVFAMSGVLLAQVVLTPVNQNALLLTSNTNVFSLSNATWIVSDLRRDMAQTNVDLHLNAHGMTNRGSLSLDGKHITFCYDFPGTDRTLVLETRRHCAEGRVAVASLLIWAHSVVPEPGRSLVEGFRQETGVGLRVFAPGAAPDGRDIFDYEEPTTAGPRLLFSVQPEPPEQGRAKEDAQNAACTLVTLLVLALLGVLPTWGYSNSWGYAPGGIVGLLLVIVIILALLGRI